MFTKIITLSLIIFFVLLIFRFFKNISSSNRKNNKTKDEIIDLEKDPKTDEYKTKE
tara:strand:- start:118 stop:285 length:168 start_codon:yes stop_codon:yes gene_type:complete